MSLIQDMQLLLNNLECVQDKTPVNSLVTAEDADFYFEHGDKLVINFSRDIPQRDITLPAYRRWHLKNNIKTHRQHCDAHAKFHHQSQLLQQHGRV